MLFKVKRANTTLDKILFYQVGDIVDVPPHIGLQHTQLFTPTLAPAKEPIKDSVELSYKDLKNLAKAEGMQIKGNPSKKELVEFLNG